MRIDPSDRSYQHYLNDLQPAGIHLRKDEAIAFISGSDQLLESEREPHNPHDSHALAIYGVSTHSGREVRRKLGYLDASLSAEFAAVGLLDLVAPVLDYAAVSPNGWVTVIFHLDGPVSEVKRYREYIAHQTIQAYREEAGSSLPRGGLAKTELGGALERVGEYDDAIECYEAEIRSRDPAPHPFRRLLVIYGKLKKVDDQIRVCKRALRVRESIRRKCPESWAIRNFDDFETRLEKLLKKKEGPNKSVQTRPTSRPV